MREEIVWVYIALIALAALRSTVQGLPVLSTFRVLRREQVRWGPRGPGRAARSSWLPSPAGARTE